MTKPFSDFPLIPELKSALSNMGYAEATPIQAASIGPLLEGRDLLGVAQTGTGKTAAFGIPLIQLIHKSDVRPAPHKPVALVLAPTRELVSQISDNLVEMGSGTRVKRAVVYGGVDQRPQVASLKRGVHILVATPGRLLDLIDQGFCSLDGLRHFVLDEADRMLDMGFMPDIKKIVRLLPRKRQSIFFSATMPPAAESLASSLLHQHVTVMVAPPATTVETVKQRVYFVEKGNKRKLLDRILAQPDATRVLVFTKTKYGADRLYKSLIEAGVQADGIHSGRSQNARQRVLQTFRNGTIRVLVSTDVAARGIDVEKISHVINFDVPHDSNSYVHRIGRTARAGESGTSLTFCDREEFAWFQVIEKRIGQAIPVDRSHPYHSPDVDDVELHRVTKQQLGKRLQSKKSGVTRDKQHKESMAYDDYKPADSPVRTRLRKSSQRELTNSVAKPAAKKQQTKRRRSLSGKIKKINLLASPQKRQSSAKKKKRRS